MDDPKVAPTQRHALKLTPVPSDLPRDRGAQWKALFRVRGERVSGMLHAPPSPSSPAGLAIWVHGEPGSLPLPPSLLQTLYVMELNWPLVGPRHDPKISPLLARCLGAQNDSEANDSLWARFCVQSSHEVSSAIAGLTSQTVCEVGPLLELRLDWTLEHRASERPLPLPGEDDITAPQETVTQFLMAVRQKARNSQSA